MVIGVIPARLHSIRFPNKILAPINDKPMVMHVYDRAKEADKLDDVIIAIDSNDTEEALKSYKPNIQMTDLKHLSGTDRVAEVINDMDADVILNIQGDEPVVNVHDIETLLAYNRKYPDRVVFGKTKANVEEFNDHSKAKVVCSREGRLLYSSRAGIPINNKGESCIIIPTAISPNGDGSNDVWVISIPDNTVQLSVEIFICLRFKGVLSPPKF